MIRQGDDTIALRKQHPLMWRNPSVRFRRLAGRVLGRENSPQRLARGIAAGCAAAAIPLPLMPLISSFLFAWLVRGSKTAAILVQAIFALPFVSLFYVQIWLGVKLLSHSHMPAESDVDALRAACGGWVLFSPWRSTMESIGHLSHTSANLLVPLSLGTGITAVAAAALAYPPSVVVATWYYTYRLRKRIARGAVIRSPRGNLVLPDIPVETPLADPSKKKTLLDRVLDRYAIYPATFGTADSVKLLIDGIQAYPEMLRCIANARKSVHLETYILRADNTGKHFSKVLIAAARRGVRVRLLYDGVGGLGLPREYIETLLRNGVEVRVFRPLATLFWRGLSAMNRRDHRKILIVDKQIAFTGGLNIADDYANKELGGAGWRDTHLRLDGEFPARAFSRLFASTWRQADNCSHSGPQKKAEDPVEESTVLDRAKSDEIPVTSTAAAMQVLSNKEFLQRVRIRRAYLRAIAGARHYILIENAYFIPDRGVRRALRKAVKRGVKVGIVVAMYSDVKLAAMASRALYAEMLEDGIRLFEYPASMVHSKIAVVDDVWSMVSSYNFDHRSLFHSLECGALLLDRPFAQALKKQMLADIGNSREITREFHQTRHWEQTLLESTAYQVRYWL